MTPQTLTGLKTAVILKVCSVSTNVQDTARNWFLEETSLGKEDYCDLHLKEFCRKKKGVQFCETLTEESQEGHLSGKKSGNVWAKETFNESLKNKSQNASTHFVKEMQINSACIFLMN